MIDYINKIAIVEVMINPLNFVIWVELEFNHMSRYIEKLDIR